VQRTRQDLCGPPEVDLRHSGVEKMSRILRVASIVVLVVCSHVDGFVLGLHRSCKPFKESSLHDLLHSHEIPPKIRLNKVFKATHSRRQADVLIASGRVTVNGLPVDPKGMMVQPFEDVIHMDGKEVTGWESMNALTDEQEFQYIKYWKPIGVVCTTDRRIEGNILDALESAGYSSMNRVYPVGRLDKDSSGLILLTNDGRLPNSLLRERERKAKVYIVRVNRPFEQADLQQLRVRTSQDCCYACF